MEVYQAHRGVFCETEKEIVMELIAHRINRLEELRALPEHFGVELDLRDQGDQLIMVHDPFSGGEDFESYLKEYRHGTLILNIKSERIEPKVQQLIEKYKIPNYFYLDSSIPMIVQLSKGGLSKIAVRVSEYESLETVMRFRGLVDWVWVDCFSRIPLTSAEFKTLKSAGFKLCFVSPELQGQPEKIEEYRDFLKENEMFMDAICTKEYNASKWLEGA